MFFSNVENIKKMEAVDVVPSIIEMFDSNLDELLDLTFDKEKNPFLNREWYENNVTLPHMKTIIETLMIINDMNKSFLGQRGNQQPPMQTPVPNLGEVKK